MELQNTVWFQSEITLNNEGRGCHYITSEITSAIGPQMSKIRIGLCTLLLLHTSASIILNESYDPDVLVDMETVLNRMVPEGKGLYKHTEEGADDMPSHAKSGLLGTSLTIPITNGKFNMGTWQGVWLCEHRAHSGPRKLSITIQGVLKKPHTDL